MTDPPLEPGQQLGHYTLVEKIGQGGMGMVWRATDERLERAVALKMLPPEFTADPERLGRFQREAKMLAALAHPGIATLFGLEEFAGPRHVLVMEFAEGEDLSRRIARGPIPVADAVPLALEIARALEYAHEHGIVHRDLKPANISLSPDAKIKLLDFGLAKALDPSTADGYQTQHAHSPTLTAMATHAGIILGTAAYMSPEQAAGKPADTRSDIWAFGVVLYEMLGGKQLFSGETVSHVLAGVLKDEPDWAALPVTIPPPVLALLRRCLRRNRQRRLQAIGDARIALEEWLEAPETTQAPAATAQPTRSRALLPWGVAAGLGLALVGVLAQQALHPPPALRVAARLPLSLPAGQSLDLDEQPAVAISPDGRRLVMEVRSEKGRQLLLRDLAHLEARLLEGTENASAPFFSPDGEWVGFISPSGLGKIAVAGGPPVYLGVAANQNRGATWCRDGTIVFAPNTQGGLQRISAAGGAVMACTVVDSTRRERTHRWPHALPDGCAVLFISDTFESTEYYDDARIEAVSLATGERHVLVEQSSSAQYLAGGPLVFARGGSLYAVRFEPRALRTEGAPVLVLQGVATDVSSGAVHFALSASGSILYASGDLSAGMMRRPTWVDRAGVTAPTGLEPGRHAQMNLSPDGQRVATLTSVGQAGDMSIWIGDLERRTLSRLSFEGVAADPIWTPDGRRVAYSVTLPEQGNRGGDIYWKPADGSVEAEPLWVGEATTSPMSFTPDGKNLAVDYWTMNDGSDIWILPLEGDRKPWPFLQTHFDEFMASISPDGRWLAYAANESGIYEVYVRPFPGPGGRWQISSGGGREPRWSHDGREIYFRKENDLLAVPVDTRSGFVAGRAERLFGGVTLGGTSNPRVYDVAPDGRFLVFPQVEPPTGPGAGGSTGLNLVLDWAVEVQQRLSPSR